MKHKQSGAIQGYVILILLVVFLVGGFAIYYLWNQVDRQKDLVKKANESKQLAEQNLKTAEIKLETLTLIQAENNKILSQIFDEKEALVKKIDILIGRIPKPTPKKNEPVQMTPEMDLASQERLKGLWDVYCEGNSGSAQCKK